MNFYARGTWLLGMATICCLWLAACADLRDDIGDDTYVSKGHGIVFANFSLESTKGITYYTFGLVVSKVGETPDETSIVLPFNASGGMFATDLDPGDYKMTGTMISAHNGEHPSYHPFKNGLSVPFTLKPGQAVYIGDYHLSYSVTYDYRIIHTEWHLDKIGNTFDSATKLFKTKYARLNSFTVLSAAPVPRDYLASPAGKDPINDL